MKMAGVEDDHIATAFGAFIAFGNFIFTLIGLYFIERSGRRPLILASLLGIILSLVFLSLSFYLSSTTTQSSCPTDPCFLNNCDDCVIQDNCFYCQFPSNASYSQPNSVGYCINQNWTTLDDHCWVPQSLLSNDSSCGDYSYVYPSLDPPNDTLHYGSLRSTCPNKFSWFVLTSLIMYIVFFAPGMGPVPWTVNTEIYPNWVRNVGNSVSYTTKWTTNLLVSITFLNFAQYLTRYGVFALYVGLAMIGWVYIFLLLPETKGKTLEEVEGLFKGSAICPPPGLRATCKKQVTTK